MSETTGPQRAAFAAMINKGKGMYVGDVPRTGLRALLNDAERLAAIEQDVRELADEEMDAARYMKTVDPDRAYRQRCRARRLRAMLDHPEGS